MDIISQIEAGLGSKDRHQRIRALDLVATKRAGSIELKTDDRRVIPLLIQALSAPSLRVRRGAAMTLGHVRGFLPQG